MILGGWTYQIYLIGLMTGDKQFSVDVSCINDRLLCKQVPLVSDRVNSWKSLTIWGRADGGSHLRDF